MPEKLVNLYCTFCGKSPREVRKLIAGPTVYICDECIWKCNHIIAQEATNPAVESRNHLEKKERAKTTVTLLCSFCGKGQQEVRKLIAGPTVYICDECIKLCNDILAQEAKRDEPAPERTPAPPKEHGRARFMCCCSFCGKNQREVKKLIAGPSNYICDECIGLCNDIIAEEIDREERAQRAALAALPEDVRARIAGIFERGLPAAERVLAVFRQQGPEAGADRSASREDTDEGIYGPRVLAGAWKDLHEMMERTAKEKRVRSAGSSSEGAEAPGWVQPVIERLSATLEVLELLARRVEEPHLEELRPSLKLASEQFNKAADSLLTGEPSLPIDSKSHGHGHSSRWDALSRQWRSSDWSSGGLRC
jgi:hypothetical protein